MKPGPKPGFRAVPLSERFWEKVDRRGPDECWPWKRGANAKGYGTILGGSTEPPERRGSMLAHRVAWELTHGPIPEGLCVLHHCDNPPCCNPSHLFLGTPLDNMKDKSVKGRCRVPFGEGHKASKLTEALVKEIRESSLSALLIAQKLGIGRATIYAVRKRLTWKHVA